MPKSGSNKRYSIYFSRPNSESKRNKIFPYISLETEYILNALDNFQSESRLPSIKIYIYDPRLHEL